MSSALVLVAAGALGIGAASFASFGDGFWERGRIYLGTSLESETGT